MPDRGYTSNECRELDRRAIEDAGVPGLLLMEHASIGAARLALDLLRTMSAASRARIYCGPGNNGGDGYAIARHLLNAGFEVEIWELSDPTRTDPESDASVNRRLAGALDIGIIPISARPVCPGAVDLHVDAIFGTGLSRPPDGAAKELIEFVDGESSAGRGLCLAIDVPSGIRGDGGPPLGVAIHATATITFGLPKRALFDPACADYIGRAYVASIGVPRRWLPDDAPGFPPEPIAVVV